MFLLVRKKLNKVSILQDGSVAVNAYNGDGKCMKIFISTKPCPYPSIPSKVFHDLLFLLWIS